MSITAILLFPLPSFGYRHAARPILRAALPDRAEVLWQQTLRHHEALARARQRRYTPGLTLVIRYLEWNAALWRALRDEGVAPSLAGELIERISWAIYGPATTLTYRLSRLRSGRLWTRVGFTVDLMFALFLTRPFQRRKRAATDAHAFDILGCPLAAWCREHEVPELTRHAACSLDHRMAETWGVELQRRGTLADGAPLCDFRFQPRSRSR